MPEETIEQRVFRLEMQKKYEQKEKEEKEKQCQSHVETTQNLEDFMNQHKIEHATIKSEIESKASKEQVTDLKNGWRWHLIQAVITVCGIIFLYLSKKGA